MTGPYCNSKVKQELRQLALGIAVGSFAVAILGPMIIIGWQSSYWLYTGIWMPLSLETFVVWFQLDLLWIYQPTSWHGFAKVCRWALGCPLAAIVPAGAIVIGSLASRVMDE